MKRQKITHLQPDWGIDIEKLPQFEIHQVVEQDNHLYVIGVSHTSIKLRQSFRQICQYQEQELPDNENGEIIAEANFRVSAIVAYQSQLNRINANMLATLELAGDKQSLLTVLRTNGWHYNPDKQQWLPAPESSVIITLRK